jgi:hypothetical protein
MPRTKRLASRKMSYMLKIDIAFVLIIAVSVAGTIGVLYMVNPALFSGNQNTTTRTVYVDKTVHVNHTVYMPVPHSSLEITMNASFPYNGTDRSSTLVQDMMVWYYLFSTQSRGVSYDFKNQWLGLNQSINHTLADIYIGTFNASLPVNNGTTFPLTVNVTLPENLTGIPLIAVIYSITMVVNGSSTTPWGADFSTFYYDSYSGGMAQNNTSLQELIIQPNRVNHITLGSLAWNSPDFTSIQVQTTNGAWCKIPVSQWSVPYPPYH